MSPPPPRCCCRAWVCPGRSSDPVEESWTAAAVARWLARGFFLQTVAVDGAPAWQPVTSRRISELCHAGHKRGHPRAQSKGSKGRAATGRPCAPAPNFLCLAQSYCSIITEYWNCAAERHAESKTTAGEVSWTRNQVGCGMCRCFISTCCVYPSPKVVTLSIQA